ncbi:MAG TPA: ABC transporter permease [Candidatus Eisenbacteria bacterium]|jgi:ABC-2 type transport system permease protein
MRRLLQVLRTSTWLGWQVEANWADPLLFLGLAVARPLATTLILFLMVRVVAPAQATSGAFLQIFLGNVFFLYVGEMLVGLSWAIFRDREDYETLKYIYLAPFHFLPYLLGRGMTRLLTATIGVAAALLFGRFLLGLSIGAGAGSWGLALLATACGLVAILWLGMLLAGIALIVARHSMNLNEGLTGIFYLLCGAVFPLEVLPRWAQSIALALPFTYWLELLRRILTGRGFAGPLAGHSDGALWAVLLASTAALAAAGLAVFAWCERIARANGYIDRRTNY